MTSGRKSWVRFTAPSAAFNSRPWERYRSMSENPVPENQGTRKITPAEVPLSNPIADGGEPQFRAWYQNRLTVFALAATVLLALLVIFVLPELVRTPETQPVAVETIKALPAKPLESPFQEAQLAKARREAQDVLKQILEKQQYLEKKQVVLWGKQRFEQAMDSAAQGDVYYRQRNFAESLSSYGSALGSLAALEREIPAVIAAAMESGAEYLKKGDGSAAAEQFKQVLAIEPTHGEAASGLRRSDSLDQVLALVAQGDEFLEQGELDKAKAAFEQAVKLDHQSARASEGKRRAEALILDRDFVEAMSAGYSALDKGKLAEAEKAFIAATRLRPQDKSASSALVQARNRAAQRSLNQALVSAEKAERAEQWQQARDIYKQVLGKDSSVIDARVGELRTSARADLDSAIEKLLSDPIRLATPGVFRRGEQTLRDAKGVSNPGPRLQRQISGLEASLKKAASPVLVKLISDNQTRVNLYKVGELGNFSSKQVALTPGNYVATGVRPGYRDVRVEFQVTGEDTVNSITIICTEPV